jgi:hypothetical protein
MKNKTKFFFASFAILGMVLFFVYLLFKDKKQEDGFNEGMEKINAKEWEQTSEPNLEEDEGIAFELSLIDKCDKGEWMEVRNMSEQGEAEIKEFDGFLLGVESAGEIFYKLEKFEKRIDFGRPEFGEFLEDRNVLIAATEAETEILVYKVKCTERVAMEEIVTNENASGVANQKEQFELEAMNKLASEINTLTKKEGNWEVESFLWPNEEYVYVEFVASENDLDQTPGENLSDEEAESFLLLLKVNKENQEIVTNEIGLLKINRDDQWVAERGKDIFENVDSGRLFSFDFALGKWVKIN